MSRVTARSTRRQPATLLPQKMVSGSGSEEVRLSEMEVDTAHVYTYHLIIVMIICNTAIATFEVVELKRYMQRIA